MNKQFDDWIREFTPPIHVNEMKKEAHLAVLKERMRAREIQGRRRHRRFRRQGLIPVVFMLMMVGWGVTELGSDDFESLYHERPGYLKDYAKDHTLVYRDFTKDKFNIREDATPAEVEDFAMQIAARIGDPVGMLAYTVGGSTYWRILRDYDDGNGMKRCTQDVLDRPEGMTRKHLEVFQSSEWDEFAENVDSGRITPSELTTEILDGAAFKVRVYRYQSERFGPIIYMLGEPIPQSGNE